MFHRFVNLINDIKARIEFHVVRVAALFGDCAAMEAETQKKLAEIAKIRAAAASMNAESAKRILRLEREKVKAFHELARKIAHLPDPADRKELMDSLKASSMGQAAFRRFH